MKLTIQNQKCSTVTAYLSEFKCLSTRVTILTTTTLLNYFLSGLHEDIQRELYILRPHSIHDAIGLAKLLEDKCNAARASQRFFPPWAPLPNPLLATSIPPNQVSPALPPIPIKILTPAEMAIRQECGLCYNCDSKFTKGHRCNPLQRRWFRWHRRLHIRATRCWDGVWTAR